MAIALVGSIGTVATGTTTASPTFGQTTTAGNLIIAQLTCSGATVPGLPSGWTNFLGTGTGNAIYWKENCNASETAPTFTPGGSFVAVRLAEYSGAKTVSADDQTGNSTSTTSPATATAAGADGAAGSLIVSVDRLVYSMAATKTTSDSFNNGATPTSSADNDATSTIDHYRFSYGITTGNAGADTNTVTFTITNILSTTFRIASFEPAPAAVVIPDLVMAPRHA